MATKVKLRQKPMAGGKESLYLDFYPPIVNPQTGKSTRREFLKLQSTLKNLQARLNSTIRVRKLKERLKAVL